MKKHLQTIFGSAAIAFVVMWIWCQPQPAIEQPVTREEIRAWQKQNPRTPRPQAPKIATKPTPKIMANKIARGGCKTFDAIVNSASGNSEDYWSISDGFPIATSDNDNAHGWSVSPSVNALSVCAPSDAPLGFLSAYFWSAGENGQEYLTDGFEVVQGTPRWKCENNTPVQYQAVDANEGYGSAAAAEADGCGTTAPAPVPRLGGLPPHIDAVSDSATHRQFELNETFGTFDQSGFETCAGIDTTLSSGVFNYLLKRRVNASNQNIAGVDFEELLYDGVGFADFLSLSFYSTESRWEFAARGDYGDESGTLYPASNQNHRQQNSNGNDLTRSNSTFIVMPATEGAPVDPTLPPVEPTPDCTVDCSFIVDDLGDDIYRVTAVASGVQNPPVSATWTRDGAALASTALFAQETIAKNGQAVFAVTLVDGSCEITRAVTVKNDDDRIVIEPTPEELPLAPDAPIVARDCGLAILAVTAPALPTRATSLEIARDDAPDAVIALGSFDDSNAGQNARSYRARGVNSYGRGEWGPYSAAIALRSPHSLEWETPDAGAIVGGLVPLRVRVVLAAGAAAIDAVKLGVNGRALDAQRAPSNGLAWVLLLDARDFEFQGDLTATAYAIDADGCRTPTVARTFRLNSSLRRDGSHFDLLLHPGEVAAMERDGRRVRKLTLCAQFVTGEVLGRSAAHDSFWELYLACPDPGPLAAGGDIGESLEPFAVAAFNKPMLMREGDDPLDHSARARIIERPVEVAVKWATGCDRISKIRLLPAPTDAQIAADETLPTTDRLGVFGRGDGAARRAAWFTFDEDGLHESVDLSAAGLASAFDACQTVAGDVVVCDEAGLFVIDPNHPLDFQGLRRPAGETRPARGVERAGELVYFWFGDENMTNLYVREGVNLAARGQIELQGKFVRAFAVRDIVLFCLSREGQYHIYRFEAGAGLPAPTLVYSSVVAVTALAAFPARAGETDVPPQVARYANLLARWGDEAGNVRETETAGLATTWADLGAPVAALGLFKGADLEARGVAGAGASELGATLWRENGSGIYAPERGWARALEVSALHRLELAVGDKFEESLVGGTQGTADDAAFVFRVQGSEPTRDRGVSVGDLAFRATGTAPV